MPDTTESQPGLIRRCKNCERIIPREGMVRSEYRRRNYCCKQCSREARRAKRKRR